MTQENKHHNYLLYRIHWLKLHWDFKTSNYFYLILVDGTCLSLKLFLIFNFKWRLVVLEKNTHSRTYGMHCKCLGRSRYCSFPHLINNALNYNFPLYVSRYSRENSVYFQVWTWSCWRQLWAFWGRGTWGCIMRQANTAFMTSFEADPRYRPLSS